jgi:hypothetical protein
MQVTCILFARASALSVYVAQSEMRADACVMFCSYVLQLNISGNSIVGNLKCTARSMGTRSDQNILNLMSTFLSVLRNFVLLAF